MSIVDLAVAARHLGQSLDDDGDTIATCLERAESLVLAHLERDAYEDDEEIPAGVQHAVLLVLTEIYDNRTSDPLTQAAISLLTPFRTVGVF